MLRASCLPFMVSIFALQVISENPIPISNEPSPIFETLSGTGYQLSPILEAISRAGREPSPILRSIPGTGYIIGPGPDRALSTALSSPQSNCDGCNFNFEIESAPWAGATPTITLQVLIDNSTNITSTWTTQDQFSTFETEVSIGFRDVGNEVTTVPLEEKVHLVLKPLILQPVSALTITRTSFTSLAKSTIANPSPSPIFQNPLVSATTPDHTQNTVGTPHSDDPSPKLVTSQVSQLISDPPPVHIPAPTPGPKPQLAPPKEQSIKHNANAPGKVDSDLLNTLDSNLSGNHESGSPSSTPVPPVKQEFNGLNSPNLNSPPISASNNPNPFTLNDFDQSKPTPDRQLESKWPLNTKLNPDLPSEKPVRRPVITIGSKTVTADPLLRFVVDGKTLSPGGSAIKVDGTPMSLAPSASHVVIGYSTVLVAFPQPSNLPLITLDDSIITANSLSRFVIDGQTLRPGGPEITFSGTPISLAPSAFEDFIGSSTLQLLTPSPLSLPFLTIGDKIFAPNSASQYIIDGQTLKAGSPVITVSGMPISLAPSASNIVIGGNTVLLATAPITAHGLAFGGKSIFLNSASEYVVDSQTIIPGAPPVTISGTPISLDQSASSIVIGGTTIAVTGSATPRLPLTIDGTTILPNSASEYVIGTQTLTPGASGMMMSGIHISLVPSATAVIVGDKTVPLTPSPTITAALPLITIGNSVITPNAASQYVIAGQTLVRGGPAITVSGTRISLAPSASNVVIGGSTIPLAIAPITAKGLTFGGKSIFLNSASEYVIGSQTLIPGASNIIVSGTHISLAPFATAVIVGGKTIPLTSSPTTTTALPLITIGNSVITPNTASQYVIAGQTLVPGGTAITVSGTRISLAPRATNIVIGTSTEGLSRLILTAYGSTATPNVTVNGGTSATGPVAFQSAGTKSRGRRWNSAIFILGYVLWGWM
ncbi:hypothetical protein MMC29_000293 [Sticta canariensis]|nr:hypothetical protein [Sticta canariensis]